MNMQSTLESISHHYLVDYVVDYVLPPSCTFKRNERTKRKNRGYETSMPTHAHKHTNINTQAGIPPIYTLADSTIHACVLAIANGDKIYMLHDTIYKVKEVVLTHMYCSFIIPFQFCPTTTPPTTLCTASARHKSQQE